MHVLGALVRSQAAECSFSRARARKKKSRPITALHRGAAEEPPGIRRVAVREHTFESNGPRDAQERVEGTKRTARDMGRGMMTGSHTPWAQGPANLFGKPLHAWRPEASADASRRSTTFCSPQSARSIFAAIEHIPSI